MQGLLPAGWLAFAGRELNPLDHVERFQIIFSSPSPGFFLAQRTAGFPQYGWRAGFQGAFPDRPRLKSACGICRSRSGARSAKEAIFCAAGHCGFSTSAGKSDAIEFTICVGVCRLAAERRAFPKVHQSRVRELLVWKITKRGRKLLAEGFPVGRG
jgi:hypothetical protein